MTTIKGENCRMVLQSIDKYRVTEPMFEGVRIILSFLGERYSPAYIQGISSAAFRIAGICPCAPTCCAIGEPTDLSRLRSAATQPIDLLKLLGYESEHFTLSENNFDPEIRINEMVKRVKDEIRKGHPVLVWNAFTYAEWDVVAGFDDNEEMFFGRGSYAGLNEYAKESYKRAKELQGIPALGAIYIGPKTGSFNSYQAEKLALEETVRHARSKNLNEQVCGNKWTFLEGIQCYNHWVDDFKNPQKARGPGDSYCYTVYRSTHRAAGSFLRKSVQNTLKLNRY